MKFFLLSAALVVGSATAAKPAQQGGIPTCDAQAGCMKFTKTKMPNGVSDCTSDCVYQVCMEFDFSKPTCSKSGTISHVCDMADGKGCMRSPLKFDGDSGDASCSAGNTSNANKCAAPSGFSMCQYGVAGETLRFVIKDGSDGNAEQKSYASSTLPALFTKSTSSCDKVSCTNGNDTYNCGGKGTRPLERVWSYKLEVGCTDCTSSIAAPVTTKAPVSPTTKAPVSSTTKAPTTQNTPQDICSEDVRIMETIDVVVDKNDDGDINPGDTVEYKIIMTNKGSSDIPKNGLNIISPNDSFPQQAYLIGTCRYFDKTTNRSIKCDQPNKDGIQSLFPLPKNGGVHILSFRARIQVGAMIYNNQIGNKGVMDSANPICPSQKFSVSRTLEFEPEIMLIKSVYLGHDVDCTTKTADEDDDRLVQKVAKGLEGAQVTYCYQVTNTGSTYLDGRTVKDPDMNFESRDLPNLMAPGDIAFAWFRTTINGPVKTEASVAGNPVYYHRTPIVGYPDVTDVSTAGVKTILKDSDITIEKTVHLGRWPNCNKGEEITYGLSGTEIMYCYLVTNTGDTYLTDLVMKDDKINFTSTSSDVPKALKPGDSFWIRVPHAITKTMKSPGIITAMPSDANGTKLAGGTAVSDSDPAGVSMFAKQNIGQCPPNNRFGVKSN